MKNTSGRIIMISVIGIIVALTVGIFVWLIVKKIQVSSEQPVVTRLPTSVSVEQPRSSYSYCKPDEDPDFKLTNEDDLYYYYTGNKSIRGTLYQQNQNSPITFDVPIDQACRFELTKNYILSPDIIKKDFDVDTVWKNQPHCTDERGGSLEGEYTIDVKGFKISKSYIQQYDPRRMIDKLQMSGYSFYVDYDKIERVDEKLQVRCPIVLY